MTKSIINIGLACGGTGGHISPALALASNFENYNIKPVFITDVRGSSLLKSMSHYVVLSGSPSTKGFTKVINMLKIFFGIAYQHQVVKFKHLEFKQNFFYLITMIFTHHLILFLMAHIT